MGKIGQWSYPPIVPHFKRYSSLNRVLFWSFFLLHGLGLKTLFLRPLTSSAFYQLSLGWKCLWNVKQTLKLYTAHANLQKFPNINQQSVLPRTFPVIPCCLPTLSPLFTSEVMTTTRAQLSFKLTLVSKRLCQIYQKICCLITTMHLSQPASWKSLLQQVGLTHRSNKQDAANRDMDPGKDRLQ